MAEYSEVRDKRGIVGKIMAFIFWGWNALMVFWLGSAAVTIDDAAQNAGSAAEQAGAQAGGTIGVMMIFFFWVAGTIVLAIPFLLSRGKKRWVES